VIKSFTHWINEAKSLKPTTRDQLKALVEEEIEKQGPQADLNHINVSNVKKMGGMFRDSQFNGDISAWDVSNVKNMSAMFYDSKFNGDISAWDVSNVKNMRWMFEKSKFSGDITQWAIPLEMKVKLYSQMSSFKTYKPDELESLIQVAIRQKQPLDSNTVKALAASRAFQTLKTSKKFGI
jgi:surface protein